MMHRHGNVVKMKRMLLVLPYISYIVGLSIRDIIHIDSPTM